MCYSESFPDLLSPIPCAFAAMETSLLGKHENIGARKQKEEMTGLAEGDFQRCISSPQNLKNVIRFSRAKMAVVASCFKRRLKTADEKNQPGKQNISDRKDIERAKISVS